MPRGRKTEDPWDLIKLPNAGSEHATAASLAIDLRYEQLNIWSRWTWTRYLRLCNLLKLTPAELASVACIPHRRLAMFERENHLLDVRSQDRSGALLLTLLESYCAKHLTNDIVESPFPNLNMMGRAE